MPSPTAIDLAELSRALADVACRFDVDCLPVCDSTNQQLLARATAGAPSGTVLIAERQLAGRGRRGRPWFAAPGDSLTFSLLWRFPAGTPLPGLSLAVGLAVVMALEKVGAGGTALQLKWPNDVLLEGRKLAGILVELLPGAPHIAVIGIGLNRRLPADMPAEIQAGSAALDALPAVPPLPQLLAGLLREQLTTLEYFAAAGFAGLRGAWLQRHAFSDRAVVLHSDFAPAQYGICRGVAEDGGLLLESDGRIQRILSGEVSLRRVA